MKLLTQREITCLSWAADGKTSWEISRILDLAERTVNFHIHNACQKLGVHGRQAAITAALRSGLLPETEAAVAQRARTSPRMNSSASFSGNTDPSAVTAASTNACLVSHTCTCSRMVAPDALP